MNPVWHNVRQAVEIMRTAKREHSRKPDELYTIIEECSPGPYLELFARRRRAGWVQWGNEVDVDIAPKPKPLRRSRAPLLIEQARLALDDLGTLAPAEVSRDE